ncbi:hypothetical protein ANANG_G00002860 [Anguilla anguilla]|uniref:Immunoglobulin V-set domain-containing protein n=1 Tax=Anguilla anguilla TaxID=7936 RepID=A0A9D3MYD2_ANGAN|nr:hypothetical protein ANANG_G00002860 [Anguilla anguilla]
MGPPAGFYLWVVLFGLRREAARASLSVSVPDRVAALSGSCAVIPCSFPAAPGRRYQLKLRYDSAMLLLRGTAFSSEEPLLGAHRDFRGRTAAGRGPPAGGLLRQGGGGHGGRPQEVRGVAEGNGDGGLEEVPESPPGCVR